jgi:hypothetical protein
MEYEVCQVETEIGTHIKDIQACRIDLRMQYKKKNKK